MFSQLLNEAKKSANESGKRFAWSSDAELELVDNSPTLQRLREFKEGLEDHHVHADAEAHTQKHEHTFNHHHIESIEGYKNVNYSAINKHLRKAKGKDVHETAKGRVGHHIKHLDHVTNHASEHEKHVYRGLHKPIEKLKVGSKHKDHAYMSTSHNLRTTKAFAHNHVDEHGHEHYHVAKIHLPKGSKHHHLDNELADHHNKREQEVLVHRGTTLKVTHHTHHVDDKGHHIHVAHMTVHSQD